MGSEMCIRDRVCQTDVADLVVIGMPLETILLLGHPIHSQSKMGLVLPGLSPFSEFLSDAIFVARSVCPVT